MRRIIQPKRVVSSPGVGGGTLKRVGQEILVPQPFGNYGGTNSYYLAQAGGSSHILNAVGEFAYLIARVPENFHGKTIKVVYVGLQSVDATGDLDFSIGKTFSSGVPSANADTATHTFLSTGSLQTIKVTFPTGMAVSRGETFFVGAASTSCQVKLLHNNARNINDLVKCRSYVNTGTPTHGTLVPMMVVEASDGTVGQIEGLSFVLDGDGSNTLVQGYGVANKFTAPWDATVVGLWNAQNSLVSSYDGQTGWYLYDSDESELSSVIVASRVNDYPANKPCIMSQYFSTPVDIVEGQSVFAAIRYEDASGDLRPYIWNMSPTAAHSAQICKSIPGFELWDVTPYYISADVLYPEANQNYFHPIGLILSHIK